MNNRYNLIIGSHVSLTANDFLLGSVNEAIAYGANTFMFYTGAPQNTIRKDVALFKKEQAFALMQEYHIDYKNVIVHAPYIINLCSSKIETRKLARDFLAQEIIRVSKLGFNKLVLHPGCRLDQDLDIAIEQIADGINFALNQNPNNDVIICLETMAGKGTEVGRSIDDLKKIINLINKQHLIGVCLDTCHLWDSGIDIADFDNYLKSFDALIGLEKIKCIHINDSMNILNSHKDRHQNIGYGHIGFKNLLKVIYHPKLDGIPKILETPFYDNKKGDIGYKYEIEMIKKQNFFDWMQYFPIKEKNKSSC